MTGREIFAKYIYTLHIKFLSFLKLDNIYAYYTCRCKGRKRAQVIAYYILYMQMQGETESTGYSLLNTIHADARGGREHRL